MKTILTILILLVSTTISYAEINYNYNNQSHAADKNCIAVYSVVRDLLFDDVQVKGNMVWIKKVDKTTELIAFRNYVTDLQNQLILKYAYSKQLTTHYSVYKILIKQRMAGQGEIYLTNKFNDCIK